MIPWRTIHQQRFESILIRIEAALNGTTASDVEHEVAPVPETAPAEALGHRPEVKEEASLEDATATLPEPANVEATPAETSESEAPPAETSESEAPPADTTAEVEEVVEPVTEAPTMEGGDPVTEPAADEPQAPSPSGEAQPAPTRSLGETARSFFNALPWNGESPAAAALIREVEPSPGEDTRASSPDSSGRKEGNRSAALSLNPAATAAWFFRSLPWSGKGSASNASDASTPELDEVDENSLRFSTQGVDVGNAVDDAPTAQNMLMAGMMSAAKTSRRMKQRADSHTPQDPARVRASVYFNHLNWKKSA